MNVKSFLIVVLNLFASGIALAQQSGGDTILKGSTIEVIQSYKPQVRKAPKPEWMPQLPPSDTSRPNLNYEVPQQTLYYSYTSEPLRPLALGKDSVISPYKNYIKAGAGNLATLFLDAGIGSFAGDDFESALHIHHLSQKGSMNAEQTALSGLEADGVLHQKEYDWHVGIAGERSQYGFYGFDRYAYHSDSLKQIFSSERVDADMQNKPDKDDDLFYHPSISASLYGSKFKTNETNFGFTAPLTYTIDNTLQFHASLITSFTHLKMDTAGVNNNFAELLPGITIHNGMLNGHGYLGLAVGKGGTVYVLPDIVAYYQIPNTTLNLSGGWQADVHKNTFEQLTSENPYLFNTYDVRQTRRDELFANVDGSIGAHITYTGRASWWNFGDLAVFLNNPGDMKQFNVLYDNVSAISFHGAARYVESNKWSAGIYAEFYEYYQGSQQYVWEQPSLHLKGDLTVNPLPELSITAYFSVLSGMYARDAANRIVQMSPCTDLGGSAEYRLHTRLSVFAQVSNLLNSKYERWYGYQAYGLNIYGGLRLKF